MHREGIRGVDRWAVCANAVTGQSADMFLKRNDGFYSGFYCRDSQVIANSTDLEQRSVGNNGRSVAVVELHPGGYLTDYGVEVTLNKRCASCPFYKQREQ